MIFADDCLTGKNLISPQNKLNYTVHNGRELQKLDQ